MMKGPYRKRLISPAMMESPSHLRPTFMSANHHPTNSCLNCQAELKGPFCDQCGQEARTAKLVPIKDWLGDFFGTFLKLDSKLLRTLVRVMFQPGQATVDFGKGHRVPYAGPAKVYIIVSAISIAAMTFQGSFSANMAVPGIDVNENFQKTFQFLFPFVNLLSPFLTAGILALLQPKFFFQLHLAFSLHMWTFYIALATPMVFIPPTSIWSMVGFLTLCVVGTAYIIFAHRKVYAVPWYQRIVSCGAIMFSIPLASLLFVMLLFGLATVLS